MKVALKDLINNGKEFKQHWLNYLMLLLGLDLLNQFIVIPIFRYFTTFLLQASAIPFVSFQNIVTIVTTHTFVFLILLLELVLLLAVVYWQFAFLMLSIRAIEAEQFRLITALKEGFNSLTKIRIGSAFLLILYFLLIVPFADIVYRTPLLAKIKVPEFILDYMTRTPVLLVILITSYVLIIFFGVRLLLTLPLMIFEEKKTTAAMKESWRLTRHGNWWPIVGRLILLAIIVSLFLLVFYLVIYGLQLLWDLLPGKFALAMGILNLLLIQLVSELVLVGSTVIAFLVLFAPLKLANRKSGEGKVNKRHRLLIIFTSLAVLLLIISSVANDFFYLTNVNAKAPVIISHRGVDNKNGVQNTIAALRKTAKEKPDFVEIDLHETKDQKFVVLHDENLAKLTGVDKLPSELTLKQLTKLTAREDGHEGKIASFDQYLAAAQKLHQKLLIEIKTTPKDSKKFLQNFNRQYGRTVLQNGYQVQSLDYRVVEGLHQINPKLSVFYIQPYNFTYPQSAADGYSMEYSTLNTDFIWQAHLQQHPVYAWTVNDKKIIKKMMYEQVDGLITDKVSLAKKAICEFQDESSYASRILNYLTVVHMPNNLAA